MHLPAEPCNNCFPTVQWGNDFARFDSTAECPGLGEYHAVVVFALHGDDFVIADIPGRGWCTPSGRPEAGETAWQTAYRETLEEIGSDVQDLQFIGCYFWGPIGGPESTVPVFVGSVESFGALPVETESLGACLMSMDELPLRYWRWDELLAGVFRYAFTIANPTKVPVLEPT